MTSQFAAEEAPVEAPPVSKQRPKYKIYEDAVVGYGSAASLASALIGRPIAADRPGIITTPMGYHPSLGWEPLNEMAQIHMDELIRLKNEDDNSYVAGKDRDGNTRHNFDTGDKQRREKAKYLRRGAAGVATVPRDQGFMVEADPDTVEEKKDETGHVGVDPLGQRKVLSGPDPKRVAAAEEVRRVSAELAAKKETEAPAKVPQVGKPSGGKKKADEVI